MHKKSEVFIAFLKKEQNTYKRIAEGLKNNESEAGRQRMDEMNHLIRLTEIGLEI